MNKAAGLFTFLFSTFAIAGATPYSKLADNDCETLLIETLKVEEIISENRFETTRDLVEYKKMFGPNFENALYQLGNDEIWIDMGAGFGLAQIDFRMLRKETVKLVATGFVKPRVEHMKADYTNKQIDEYMAKLELLGRHLHMRGSMPFRYVEGDILKMSRSRLARKGTVRLITDLYGPMSYASDPAKLLRLYGTLLAFNARLFIHVIDERLLIRDPKTGELYSLFQFVAKYGRGFYFSPESRFLVRNSEEIYIPDLKLVKRRSGTPPYNTYEIVF